MFNEELNENEFVSEFEEGEELFGETGEEGEGNEEVKMYIEEARKTLESENMLELLEKLVEVMRDVDRNIRSQCNLMLNRANLVGKTAQDIRRDIVRKYYVGVSSKVHMIEIASRNLGGDVATVMEWLNVMHAVLRVLRSVLRKHKVRSALEDIELK